ncbi:putative ATP-dependent RNA helicase DDX47, partial [Clarias magur]
MADTPDGAAACDTETHARLNTEEPEKEEEEEEEEEEEGVTDVTEEPDGESKSFKDLGVTEVLCEACDQLGWKKPTKIQIEAVPVALQGRDVIGLAETGSGKTGAFALPILQSLLSSPQRLHTLVLTPTRELAFQISEQFEALGSSIGVKTAVIVGGIDMMSQSLVLAKKPHVVIATPGRLIDHLENTKGFNLRAVKFLVMDEADRILNMDFESEVDKILKLIPRERHTFLFSATMTKKVQKLQRAALKDPVKCAVSSKYATVDKLQQYYIFIPAKYKDCYLVSILNELAGNSFMVFCSTCNNTQRVTLLLRNLGITAIPLHGQMSQNKRLGALNKFKSKSRSVLLATDVASRGLDIPHVDCVINFDIPTHSKDYIHRVGRTARAGRSGKSITFVTQYDVELFQRIETLIGKKLPAFPTQEEEVMMLVERVSEAQRFARLSLYKAVQTETSLTLPRGSMHHLSSYDQMNGGFRKTPIKEEPEDEDYGCGEISNSEHISHVDQQGEEFHELFLKEEPDDGDAGCDEKSSCIVHVNLVDEETKGFQENLVKEEEPNEDEFLYCEYCRSFFINKCEIHGPALFLPDTPVPKGVSDRARQTLPPGLEVQESCIPKAGLGVINKGDTVPVGAHYGPYQGDVVDREEGMTSSYSWVIYNSRQFEKYIDAKRVSHANWMRYVNCAHNSEESNLVAFQYQGEIFYRCCRPIKPRQELLVWYEEKYAKALGITFKCIWNRKCSII